MKIKLLSALIICLLSSIMTFAYNGRHGWFIQKAPQQLILCNGEGLSRAESMLLESLSGLCGQAVNEGSFDEMIWIEKGMYSIKTTPQQEKITHEEKESIIQLMWQQYMPAF